MITVALLLVHLGAAALCILHVLLYYRRPAAAVAWVVALLFLPLVGTLGYLLLAVYSGPRSIRRRREAVGMLRGGRTGEKEVEKGSGALVREMDAALDRVCSLPRAPGNRVELVPQGEALSAQLAAMRAARTEILLQTYVLKPGRTLDALVEVLGSAVDGGVDACILLDPIGSQDASEKDLDRLRCAGVEVHEFMTPNPLKGRFQINFRNHRKVLVVDREVAFTGGRNWSDEYFPDFSGADAYRDTTFRVEGPLVQQLERLFREDLAIARDDLAGVTELRSGEGLEGGVVARAMPSGPDEPVDDPVDVLAVAFRAARESILIVTPYFVPGGTLHRCLRVAALSGVRVEILLPRSSGKRSIDLSARYHMRGLLDAGARIHLHDGPLLHAKYLVIDDAWCLVGSSNLDHRSMRLNHELDLEVHAPELAASLRARYLAELGRAQVVDRTEFEKRGILARLKENAAMLFEPLL